MNTLIDEIFKKLWENEDQMAMRAVLGRVEYLSRKDITNEAKSELLKAIMQSKPDKKKIVLDRPLDIDDGEQFCVECGQWTYEGEIDCKCMDYNKALDQWEEAIRELFK